LIAESQCSVLSAVIWVRVRRPGARTAARQAAAPWTDRAVQRPARPGTAFCTGSTRITRWCWLSASIIAPTFTGA